MFEYNEKKGLSTCRNWGKVAIFTSKKVMLNVEMICKLLFNVKINNRDMCYKMSRLLITCINKFGDKRWFTNFFGENRSIDVWWECASIKV